MPRGPGPDRASHHVTFRRARSPPVPIWRWPERSLADQSFLSGDLAAADKAYGRYVATPIGEALLARADAMITRGEASASEPLLRRHLGDRPQDVKALWMLAYVLLGREAFAEAAVLLETVLQRHPGYVSARHARALAHMKLRQPAQTVVEDLMWVLAAEPGNRDARNLLGVALLNLGDPQAALEAFDMSLRAGHDEPDLIVMVRRTTQICGSPG